MDLTLPLITGLTLGFLHAFDADHLTAVSVFASKHPTPAKAFRFGLLWGLGHAVTLLVFGVIVMMLKFAIPPLIESVAELAVGLLLVGLGVWALRDVARLKKLHLHRHVHGGVEHLHFHSHADGPDHHHGHSLFAIGATHGLAGTASVVVIIPLAVSQSFMASLLFLLLFGIGTITAMALFASLFGVISAHLVQRVKLALLQSVAGGTSVVIGCVWIARVLFA